MPSLEVRLYETHVGDLVGDSWRDVDFVAMGAAIDRFGVGSTVLSESVPLVPRQPRERPPGGARSSTSCCRRALPDSDWPIEPG